MPRKSSSQKESEGKLDRKFQIALIGSLLAIFITILYATLNLFFPGEIFLFGFIPFDITYFFTSIVSLVVPVLIILILNEIRERR